MQAAFYQEQPQVWPRRTHCRAPSGDQAGFQNYLIEDVCCFVFEDCALYARVSQAQGDDRTPGEIQLRELRRYARDRGWEVTREYFDHSTGKSGEVRPALDALMADARAGRFEIVLVWRFNGFARSTRHLILGLDELRGLGIDFVSLQENIDTSRSAGQAVQRFVLAVAELERTLTSERIKAGIRRAREQGKRPGRPPVRIDVKELRKLRSQGLSVRQIGRRLGVGKSTVAKRLKALS